MEKIFKKSLAVVVSTALCLTAFIGCLTASATRTDGTLTVESTTIAADAKTAVVPITLATSDERGIAAAIFDLSFDNTALEFSSISEPNGITVDTAKNADKSPKVTSEGTTSTIKIIVEAGTGLTFPTATVEVTFNVKADATAGDHAVRVASSVACHAGDVSGEGIYSPNEDYVDLDLTKASGNVTIHEHSFTEEITTPATCTTTGLKTFTCSCGEGTYTETIPALGHTWDEGAITTAATCTVDGVKTFTCSVCGETRTEAISASGHTVVNVAEDPATCTTAGTTAGTKCSVCDAIISGCETIAALGHEFTYTANNDGTHAVACTRCDYTATEDCDTAGEDGACSKCGYKAAPAGPVLNAALASTLKSSIQISNKVGIYFEFNFYQKGIDDFEFVVSKKALDGFYQYTGGNNETVFDKTNYVSSSYPTYGLYNYSYAGIALYEMSMDITYTLYVKENGVRVSYYTWDTVTLSDLVNNYYTSNASNATRVGMAAAILNLGTAAQVYFASVGTAGNPLSTFALPNANIDTTLAPAYGDLTEYDGAKDSKITLSIQLLAAPCLRFQYANSSYKTPADMTFNATYYSNAASSNISRVTTGNKLNADESIYAIYGLYDFAFDQVALYDGDKVITFTATNVDSTVSTYETTLLSLVAKKINSAAELGGDVYRAIASLSVAAHNMWPTY